MSDGDTVPVQAHLKSSGLSVGDVARLTGVRPSAIRYYEGCGLLPAPERRSGKRSYDRSAVARLKAILVARRLGFSIAEIRRLSTLDMHDWQNAAKAKALSLRALTATLNANAAQLDELSHCTCASASTCAATFLTVE